MDFLTEDEIIIGELDDLHEKNKTLNKYLLRLIRIINKKSINKYLSNKYRCEFCWRLAAVKNKEEIKHEKDCPVFIANEILNKIRIK